MPAVAGNYDSERGITKHVSQKKNANNLDPAVEYAIC